MSLPSVLALLVVSGLGSRDDKAFFKTPSPYLLLKDVCGQGQCLAPLRNSK